MPDDRSPADLERIARNEIARREFNEAFANPGRHTEDEVSFLCECGRMPVGCTESIRVPLAEYDEVRQDPRRFMVYPGHEIEGAEQIVAKRDGYTIVEKPPGIAG